MASSPQVSDVPLLCRLHITFLCEDNQLMLLLFVFRQGDTDDSGGAVPVHLARISNKSGRHILAAALSPDGRMLAFSDVYHLKTFDIAPQMAAASPASQPGISVGRRQLPDASLPAHHLVFAAGDRLLAVNAGGHISVVDTAGRKVLRSFSEAAPSDQYGDAVPGRTACEQQQQHVAALAVSGDGRWAAAGGRGAVQLFSLVDLQHRGRLLLPDEVPAHQIWPAWLAVRTADLHRQECAFSGSQVSSLVAFIYTILQCGAQVAVALAFSPDGATLAAATASKTVHVFDTATRRPSDWMARNGDALQRSLDKLPGPILGMSLCPTAKVRPSRLAAKQLERVKPARWLSCLLWDLDPMLAAMPRRTLRH